MKIYSTMCRFAQCLILSFVFFPIMMFLSAAEAKVFNIEDTEKPQPEFSRNGDIITAKLIPRGKSTSILIDFAVSGGKPISLEATDFDQADSPLVDKKDFRSALFTARIGEITPGAEVELSMACNYFTGSTRFWVYNPKSSPVWRDVEAKNEALPDRVNRLRAKVKDGGPLDSDGESNGEITLIFGPSDSFWGYAIGTLFIRFFGVLMVLAVLQIGMNLAGLLFRTIESRSARGKRGGEPLQTIPPVAERAAQHLPDSGTAAAIAMALHLHFSHEFPGKRIVLSFSESPSWSYQGRTHLMSSRSSVFNRDKHN
ncbi:MAG: OadG family protein [Syntrophobacteraceae bacterium]